MHILIRNMLKPKQKFADSFLLEIANSKTNANSSMKLIENQIFKKQNC